MAKLMDIYNSDKDPIIKRRQLPLTIYDNLAMIMDLNTMGLICDNPQVKGRDFEEFMRKYKVLSTEELKMALRVDASDIFNVLNQNIPCVGCRRSVERLFYQLCKSGHPTLDPLVLTPDEVMTIREDKIVHPQSLATLLNGHSSGIDCLIVSQPRWKKSQRCTLHSLEAGVGVGRGWSTGPTCSWAWGGWGGRATWRAAWDAMRPPARDHVTLIHFSTLHDTLHNYLRKHRFCTDCKTKVLRAYQLLVEEKEPHKEKGYINIAHLIARAGTRITWEPQREACEKPLKLHKKSASLCGCARKRARVRPSRQLGVEALYRKFATAAERAAGVSPLLVADELAQAELQRHLRKAHKRLRRRRNKERRAAASCKEGDSEEPEDKCQCEECLLEERDTPTELLPRDYACCEAGDGCPSCRDEPSRRSPNKSPKRNHSATCCRMITPRTVDILREPMAVAARCQERRRSRALPKAPTWHALKDFATMKEATV
ncbi:hypothetical protein ACJJTC_006599 [Scirpophaga incertulas]